MKGRDYIAASVDARQPIEIGARAGVGLRTDRISLFDAATGTALAAGGN